MTPRESGFASNTSISSRVSVLFDMPVMRWSDADDGELLAASRSEPDAFMTLYRRYESAVIGYLLRRDYSTDAHAHMTWFGPRGQVLKQTTIDIAFNLLVRTPG
jgi:hypothetical protein